MTKQEFIEKWKNIYGKELADNYHYLWEVFYFKDKSDFLFGSAAKEEFRNVDKTDAICIQMWFDDDVKLFNENDFDDVYDLNDEGIIPELFVVGKDWSWSYIWPHESNDGEDGPFFIYRKNQ